MALCEGPHLGTTHHTCAQLHILPHCPVSRTDPRSSCLARVTQRFPQRGHGSWLSSQTLISICGVFCSRPVSGWGRAGQGCWFWVHLRTWGAGTEELGLRLQFLSCVYLRVRAPSLLEPGRGCHPEEGAEAKPSRHKLCYMGSWQDERAKSSEFQGLQVLPSYARAQAAPSVSYML